jgi:hypothetical protein
MRRTLVAAVLLLIPTVSFASPIRISSRSALTPSGSFDWGQLGPEFTTHSSASVTATNGLGATITDAGNSIEAITQSSGWSGNFAPGDHLLWSDGEGPVTIAFANPITGLVFQIESDQFGPFDASMQIFAGANLLATFTTSGNSQPTGDNSAIAFGALDSLAEITRIVINNTSNGVGDFAINRLDIQGSPGSTAVPEPTTLALVGAGAALLIRRRSLAPASCGQRARLWKC